MNFFTRRFVIVLITTGISAAFVLPFPWQRQSLFFWGYQKEGLSPRFPEMVKFDSASARIFQESTNFPAQVKYYDVHFVNGSKKSENQNVIFRVQFGDKSLFWQYAKDDVGQSSYEDGTSFDIAEGGRIKVKGVPIGVPVTYSSIPMCTSNDSTGCSEDQRVESENGSLQGNTYGMEVYATPNIYSWAIQLLLIFAFWAVLINSLTELTRKEP